jgi:hypothetical protein
MTAPNDIIARWSTCGPYLQSVLRLVAASMFILAGTTKLFAFPAGAPPAGGTVPSISQVGLGAVLEAFGGGVLLDGLFTRPVANFSSQGKRNVAEYELVDIEDFELPLLDEPTPPSMAKYRQPLQQLRSGSRT